ncbi:MAG: S8 family peptidase, partial [Limisphaerales bacterium]
MSVLQLGPNEKMEQALERFQASDLVEFAEPDHLLRASVVPNDPHFASGLQWSLRNSTSGRDIHAVEGWDILSSAPNIIVAVIDSGIRYTHQDLASNMWRNPGEIPGNGVDDDNNGLVDDVFGINAVNDTGNPMDDGDHGTHVAGIIGAVGNNGIGIAGVAWNVKLMACKFLDSDGYGFTSDAVQAIDYARQNGAQVINASFGGEEYSSALFSAIQSARAAGIIFVAAAGNEERNIDTYPAYPASYNLDNIIVVGGSTRTDTFDHTYSNYGATDVDLFAPGTAVYSTWGSSDSAYLSNTGTSMAAPHVAGAVALMKARYTNLTSSQIINRLLASV